MQVVEMASFGGPDVLRLGSRALPVPGTGELRIRVSASGVNRPDMLQRAGKYPPPPGASEILGLEVAGVVDAGDAEALRAAGLQLGDRVCALVAGGGYAQWCIAPVAQCLPVPVDLSDIEAASLPETLFTVWSNVFDRGRLAAGEILLVQGGTSGIGVMAIQLAKAMGARVIATAGSHTKCEIMSQWGVEHAINYRTQDFETEVLRHTQGRGVDMILDMVAGAYLEKEQRCLAEDGRLVIIATQGGSHASLDAGLLMRKRLTVTGSTLRARPVAFKQAIAQACLQQVWPLIAKKQVQPVIFRVYPPSQAASAHALMESNQHIGKIVLDWSAT